MSKAIHKDAFNKIKKLGTELSDLLLTSPDLSPWSRIEITKNEIKIIDPSYRILLRAGIDAEE